MFFRPNKELLRAGTKLTKA